MTLHSFSRAVSHVSPRHLLRASPVLAVLLLAAATPAARRWGDAGHRLVGQIAAENIPADMPPFFKKAAAQLTYLNPEPDRWKDGAERRLDPALDGSTTYDHYIDLELIPAARRAGIFAAPNRLAYADSLRTLQPKSENANTVGLLPFRIVEMTQVLRVDFRRWRTAPDSATRNWIEQRIINDAGILGHYVADGSNPAHTTIHHNGWVGDNPKGYATDNRFHGRFESNFVGAQVSAADVRPLATAAQRSLPELRKAVLTYLDQSHAELEHLYTLDKAKAFDATNDSPEHKKFAAERLAAGAVMLRDLWWTAWVTSAAAPGNGN